MTPHYAVRFVAPVPTGHGYRVRFVSCVSKDAAEYSLYWHLELGCDAEIIEVDRPEYLAIYRGERDTFKPTPGL